MRIALISANIVALLLAAVTTAAPAQDTTSTFIIRLGHDTVAVEQVTRAGNVIRGELLNRVPRTSRARYTAQLDGQGRLSSFELTRFATPESDSVAQRVTMRVVGDSAITESRAGDREQRRAVVVAPAMLPFLGGSYGMHQLAIQRAHAAGRDSVDIPFLSPGAAQPSTLEIRHRAGDEVFARILLAGGAIEHEGRTDALGRIVELRGVGGSYGSNVSRTPQADMNALRREFMARDAAGRGLGPLSPRDTLRARTGGATIEIDYSRPSARGRTIMGGLIAEGEVWRFGANQATHLRTDRELVFGQTVIPAGTYTLYAIPGSERWTLIINRQTGQWGTEYDQAQDLARIPLSVTRADAHREQFTVDIQPSARGGTLRVVWGDTVASTPFTVR